MFFSFIFSKIFIVEIYPVKALYYGTINRNFAKTMLQLYFPILVFIAFGLFMGVAALSIGRFSSPHRPDTAKLAPYECGFPGISDARLPFDIRYYLVAILFIIFDLETAFLFPWAVSLRHIGMPGLVAMGIFIGLLLLGFIYEWKKGALEWE